MSAVLPATDVPASSTSVAARAGAIGASTQPIVDAKPLSAAERLEASRVRLRAALMDIAHPPPRPSMFDGLKLGSFADMAGPLIDKVRGVPGVLFVVETVEAWWKQHPLRTAGLLAGEASKEFVLPIARQNPYGLVLGSVVLGALFVLTRPWRWLLRPALFVGLVPQLASQALKRMPVDSWLGMFESLKSKRQNSRVAARAAAAHAAAVEDPSTP